MEEERGKLKQNESSHKELSLNWLKERDELKKQATDMRSKVDDLEAAIATKDKKIKDLVQHFFLHFPFPALLLTVIQLVLNAKLILFFKCKKDTSIKDEVKKAVDAAVRKAERDVKLAKDEANNFKSKSDEMEAKLARVLILHLLLLYQ